MQTPDYRLQELKRAALAAAAGALIGWVFDHIAWFVAGALALYLAWFTAALVKLHRWLNSGSLTEPPDSFGLWGEIFDSIYRLQRREHAAQGELQGIIDRARDSVSALRDAVVIVDRDGALEWWNPAAEQLLGLRWPVDSKQVLANLVRDPRFVAWFEARDYGSMLELPSPVDDGQQLQLQVTVFGNGDRLLIARDITRIHHLEQVRREFVGNVSHELKTPLTVLKGYVETLQASDRGDKPRVSRALAQMLQQTERMDRLVNDLLLLSRLENTPPDPAPAPVAMAPMLHSLQQDAIAMAVGSNQVVTLEADPQLWLRGSEHELHSIASNLVSNAVRYAGRDARIHVRWWADAEGAHLAVADTGIGIEARHLPRLTERFYRPDSGRDLQSGGTGLGLAIVKHALKRHGGTLQVESTPGKGSTFTCHFPASRIVRHAA